MNDVNNRVVKYRKQANLTQTEVAEKLNIKCTTYSQMERKGIITADRLYKMADIFGVSPCMLFYGEEPCRKDIISPQETEASLLKQPEPTLKKEVFVCTKKEEGLIKILRNFSKENYNKTMLFIQELYKEEKR